MDWSTINMVVSNDIYPHIDAEELEGYSMGYSISRIPEEEASRLEEHLLICPACRQRVAENDSYTSAMRQAAAQLLLSPARPERRPWSFPRLIPTTAALACIVLAAGAALGVALRNSNSAAPAFAVNLAATRGAGIEAKAPAGRTLALRPDLTGLAAGPFFRLEMVDRLGNRVWQGSAGAQGLSAGASFSVPRQRPGIYFVRIYNSSGELLREYGLEIQVSENQAGR
jgi:anti-sigma factor RsiW